LTLNYIFYAIQINERQIEYKQKTSAPAHSSILLLLDRHSTRDSWKRRQMVRIISLSSESSRLVVSGGRCWPRACPAKTDHRTPTSDIL